MACPCLVVPGDEHAGRVLFSCAPQPRVGSPLPSRVHRVVRSHSGFRFSRRSLGSVTFSPSPKICRIVACVQNMIRRTHPLHLRCYCTMPDIIPSPSAEVEQSRPREKQTSSRVSCPTESLVPDNRESQYCSPVLYRFSLNYGFGSNRFAVLNQVASLLHASFLSLIHI